MPSRPRANRRRSPSTLASQPNADAPPRGGRARETVVTSDSESRTLEGSGRDSSDGNGKPPRRRPRKSLGSPRRGRGGDRGRRKDDAGASQQRAEELVEDAAHALAEARRLSDEAAEAARAAAEDANRQAQQLQNEAKSDRATPRAASRGSRNYESELLRRQGRPRASSIRRGGRSRILQETGAGRARGRHRHQGTKRDDQGRARRSDHDGGSSSGKAGSKSMRFFRARREPERAARTVTDSLAAVPTRPSGHAREGSTGCRRRCCAHGRKRGHLVAPAANRGESHDAAARSTARLQRTATDARRRRLSEGALIQASVRARLLGIPILRLDATVALTPGTASPPMRSSRAEA